VKPVNYDALAAGYDRHRRGGGPFLPTLVRLARNASATIVLELGAGTGNNTRAFIEAHPARVIALDASLGMLRCAAQKDLPAAWLRATAGAIPLAGDAVHFIFAVCVLHHIADLATLFRECRRVLTSGGTAAFVTSPHDFIERHPMNRYFPSFAAVDKARFQDVPDIVAAFHAAGFTATGVERDMGEAHPIDQAYLDKVAGRFISTYDLIPEPEFAEGIARFQADVTARGAIEESLAWECATVWGRKD
jgi:ubiquinone/menaquinone biosynthesis C-methylase UbiE